MGDAAAARGQGGVGWAQAEAFLHRRVGLLDAVVFSGGEPTSQAALPDAIAQVKAMGYQVGLHTGGMYPARLRQLLPQLDWIGLDIKAPDAHYDAVTGRRDSARPVGEALEAVLASGVAYECRTTWHPGLFPLPALYGLAEDLFARGVRHWALQECREEGRGLVAEATLDLRRLGAGFERFCFRRG